MSAVPSGDDKLRIPIEIDTGDLKELNETLNNINKAESDLRALPRKGRGTGDTSGRAPLNTSRGETPFSGGIFEESKPSAIPLGKDKTSRQAFTRENEFKKLRDQVNNVEEATSEVNSMIGNLAGSLGFAGIAGLSVDNRKLISGKGGKGAMPIGFGKAAQIGTQTAGAGIGLATAGVSGLGGKIASMVSSKILPVAVALAMMELVKGILTEMFRPGGFFDRRYRRVIDDEVASLTERSEKAEISQGIRILRTTPVAGFRGPSTSIAARNYDRGQQVWLNDYNMEGRTKGFFD
jgi:hypothetical protein